MSSSNSPFLWLTPKLLPVFLEHFFVSNCCETGFFWLDSGDGQYAGAIQQAQPDELEILPAGLGRFAFLGMQPDYRLQYHADQVLRCLPGITGIAGIPSLFGNPAPTAQSPEQRAYKSCTADQALQTIGQLAKEYRLARTSKANNRVAVAADGSQIPFEAGLVGAFSYEFAYHLQDYFALLGHRYMQQKNLDGKCGGPALLLEFAAYSAVLAVDLQLKHVYVLGRSDSSVQELLKVRALEALSAAKKSASQLVTGISGARANYAAGLQWQLQSDDSFDHYRQKFLEVKDYLRQGEIYQLNLSKRLHVSAELGGQTPEDGLCALYLKLRNEHPVPFGCFFRFADGSSLLSFSPERFFRLTSDNPLPSWIETRPMKGTRQCCGDMESSQQGYNELCHSVKERAELLMICDLLRNDLYQICDVASVQVQAGQAESWPFLIEKYPSVWQQTAAVRGKLKAGLGELGGQGSSSDSLSKAIPLAHLCQALFPCGSITGAPKIRAMELIRQLEAHPRRWYTGNIGYIDGSGNMEFNVLIRSFYGDEPAQSLPQSLQLNYHVGGGLVWDSEPLAEWQELEAKCQFFLRPLGLSFPP